MKYLAVDEILLIHDDVISEFGGSHGIRSLDLLYSAIYRPQAAFAGKDFYTTTFDKAAALLHSLALNHPFLDGNKRTAFKTSIRFMYINGFVVDASNSEVVRLMLAVVNKEMSIERISEWFKKYSKRIQK